VRCPFDELFLKYDRWYDEPFGRSAYALELGCLRELVGRCERALEVGVGTGRFAASLGIRFGIDPSENMLRVAKGRGITVVRGVGESLPFREKSFELVLLVATLCFVSDPLGVLREARRVLKGGGKLVLGLILKESSWADFYMKKASSGHPIYEIARFYSMGEVREMLSDAGFRIVKVLSTLIAEPQDTRPVERSSTVEGTHPHAGFTCISAA